MTEDLLRGDLHCLMSDDFFAEASGVRLRTAKL